MSEATALPSNYGATTVQILAFYYQFCNLLLVPFKWRHLPADIKALWDQQFWNEFAMLHDQAMLLTRLMQFNEFDI